MLEESKGAILLVGILVLVLFGAVVVDVVDDSEERAREQAILRAVGFSVGAAKRHLEVARQSAVDTADERVGEALGSMSRNALLKGIEHRRQQPAVACEPNTESSFPGVTVEFPLRVVTIEPQQFEDRTALLEYEVTVGRETFDKPMRDIYLDRGLDCGGFDRARLTIYANVDGREYRRTECMQTPGGYSENIETWLLDKPSWQFVFDWDGRSDSFRPTGGVWSPRRLPFPAGDARMMVEMQGERDGKPFVIRGNAPIVIMPLVGDPSDIVCKAVPELSGHEPWSGRDPAPQEKHPWPGNHKHR